MIQQNHGRGVRRALALIGTAALALGGLVTTGAAAQAAEVPPPGTITETEGTLNIHKHAGNPTGPGTGLPIDQSNLGIGVPGITFKIERVTSGAPAVPIDLNTNAGWVLAKTASDGFNPVTGALPAGFGVVAPAAGEWTTDANGLASGSLPFGMYRVTELANAAVQAPAAPFLVTVPYPNAGAWLYNVHVYPKNVLKDVPTKTVSDPGGIVEGSQVTWTITAPVTRPPTGSTYTTFSISDLLDARLKYVSAVVRIDGGEPKVQGVDYDLSHTGADAGTGQGGTVLVSLTGALAGLKAGQVVTVELVTTVHGVGEISNEAIRNVNGVTTEIGYPQTNWGKVKVIKTNVNGAKLEGAKFELYKADKTTKVVNETSTDSNGEILFPAVWVGNGTDKTEEYCLKETQAPPGYVTPADPWTCVTVSAEQTAIKEVPISNTQQTGPNLPLTGSTGTAVFMAGGLALIAAAAGAGLMVSRRRHQAANRP